jgi:hypothetical protein
LKADGSIAKDHKTLEQGLCETSAGRLFIHNNWPELLKTTEYRNWKVVAGIIT